MEMEETSKNRTLPRKTIICAAVILLLAAVGIFIALQGGVPKQDGADAAVGQYEMDQAQLDQETLPPVRVEMPDYEFAYAGALENVIVLEQQAETGDLAFYVSLSEGRAMIFTLCFNSDQGDFVTVLRDSAGDPVPVAFQMETIPEGLSEEDRALYFTAQDAVNEIAASLVLK